MTRRRLGHREDVVSAVAEEDPRDGRLRQQRKDRSHDLFFPVHPLQVTEPGIERAKLKARLFQNEGLPGRDDAKHDVGDAPSHGLRANRPVRDPTAIAQVRARVFRSQFEHESTNANCDPSVR